MNGSPLVCRYIHLKRQHFCWDCQCAHTLGVYACTHNWKEARIAPSASAGAYQRLKEESFAQAKMLCKTSLSNSLSNLSGELNSTHRNLLYCSTNTYFWANMHGLNYLENYHQVISNKVTPNHRSTKFKLYFTRANVYRRVWLQEPQSAENIQGCCFFFKENWTTRSSYSTSLPKQIRSEEGMNSKVWLVHFYNRIFKWMNLQCTFEVINSNSDYMMECN